MIIELKISGNVLERKNGLIEFRNPLFGSVYGRSVEELRAKLERKISLAKAHLLKKPAKKKKSPLLSAFYEETYLPYKKSRNLAEHTIKGIEYNFNYLRQHFDKPIAEYTPKEIESFLLSIEKTRKAQLLQGLLNNIFRKAVLDGIIEKNPCNPIDHIIHEMNQGKALPFTDQERFFVSLFADGHATLAQKCYFAFAYLTGARRNEALAVTRQDVDFENNVLHLPGTKTEGSDRYLPLFPLAAKLLQLMPAESKFFPFCEAIVYKIFSRHCDKFKLHDLRHTFGTIQICVNKIDVKTVSLWMGHSNIQTTLRIYTHPEHLDRGIFLSGNLSETEKLELLKEKVGKVCGIIERFIDERTQIVPKF